MRIQTAQARFVVQPDGKPRVFFMRDAVVKRDERLVEMGKPTSTVDEIKQVKMNIFSANLKYL